MVELVERSACHGLLPVRHGTVTLDEVDAGPIASLTPFGDASDVLQARHGLEWPKPGQSSVDGDLRCIWFGRDDVLLMGAAPDEALHSVAAVVDQSDAWACVELSGANAVDVLARVVPLDLRDAAFPIDATARCQIVHMSASITKVRPDCFRILVFRSMAGTLVHDLAQGMVSVATRG